MKDRFQSVFRTKTRDEWCDVMEGSDVCFAPVLSLEESMRHPHNVARGTFIDMDGIIQPGPAPRFSRTPGKVDRPPSVPGQHSAKVLRDWGFDEAEIAALTAGGIVVQAQTA